MSVAVLKIACGLLTLTLLGCEKNRIYEHNQPLSHHSWNKSDPLDFKIDIIDTGGAYDLSVNVRHRAAFESVNLWVNLLITPPSGDTTSLRENLTLGDNSAERWLGDCVGDICDVRVSVVNGVHFREKGTYQFTLSHLMWEDPLEDIMSVGLRLEKAGD